MLRRGRRILALMAFCAVAGCTTPTGETGSLPTVNEAEAFLVQVVTLAQRGDFEALCAIGDGNCERGLEMAGRDRVPLAPPAVIGVRIVPTTRSGDQTSAGGVVLEMCGRDAVGEPYHSEMLVFRDRGSLRAINPIYWGNTTIAEGDSMTAYPLGPAPSC